MHRHDVRYWTRFAAVGAVAAMIAASPAWAGTFFGHPAGSISGGLRWESIPRTFNDNERSLDGGLRYSLQGGSYEAFLELIPWNSVPTVAAFQAAVEAAFDAWESPDPVTGLATDISFVADLGTTVVGSGQFDNANPDGAEIDILVADAGVPSPRAVVGFGTASTPVTLTSGTAAYPGSSAITGADIIFNVNSGALYSIDSFRRLLTHEIGHTLGLGDVDVDNAGLQFVDDNYDGSTSATALATLTNSWALLVDPLNPASSPLAIHQVPDADPGVDTSGVDILMESTGLGVSPTNPITNLIPLRNDDYGMRQFLYPSLNFAFPPGDFNRDGVVDAADYVTWRNSLGNPFVDSDYHAWSAHFGETAGSAAQLAGVVPEPCLATLAGVSILILSGIRAPAEPHAADGRRKKLPRNLETP